MRWVGRFVGWAMRRPVDQAPQMRYGNLPGSENGLPETRMTRYFSTMISRANSVLLASFSSSRNLLSFLDPSRLFSITTPTPSSEGVSFMMTQKKKEQLRTMGYTDEQIFNMSPDLANKIIGMNLPPSRVEIITIPFDEQAAQHKVPTSAPPPPVDLKSTSNPIPQFSARANLQHVTRSCQQDHRHEPPSVSRGDHHDSI
eukprot:TRINITY_DN9030_c0_g1_i2.p1 TRINITY_DN9030_c0_g1~~TRINITY_DN9030_c0_g1_i2.p1  ORF type:complete len:213 (-),score=56.14 TRINITY_DN9030_c0_g1_i2:147-746(-)